MTLEILEVPESVVISPSGTTVIATSQLQQFTATAHFANGMTLDVTNNVFTIWSTGDSSIATISNDYETGQAGVATAIAPGTTSISVTYGVSSTPVQLTVDGGGGGYNRNNTSSQTATSGEGVETTETEEPEKVTNKLFLEIHPEKRQNTAGSITDITSSNQDINFQLEIRTPNTQEVVFEYQGTTAPDGTIEIPVKEIDAGIYDISIKTPSHLRRTLKNQSITWPTTTIDTSLELTRLLKAGDVNMEYGDNYVNGVDFSVIANHIYTSDSKSDLNRDDIVNGIDFAITANNLYQWGEE